MNKTDAKSRILTLLYANNHARLAVHEMDVPRSSQNAIASRLPEMALAGLVFGETRNGVRFKEWSLTAQGIEAARIVMRKREAAAA